MGTYCMFRMSVSFKFGPTCSWIFPWKDECLTQKFKDQKGSSKVYYVWLFQNVFLYRIKTGKGLAWLWKHVICNGNDNYDNLDIFNCTKKRKLGFTKVTWVFSGIHILHDFSVQHAATVRISLCFSCISYSMYLGMNFVSNWNHELT